MREATQIAKKYKRKECLKCVTELCENLTGTVIKIDIRNITKSTRSFIYYEDGNDSFSISDTGLHYGFLVGENVYDNLNSKGMSEKSWLSKFIFHCPKNGATVVTLNHIQREDSSDFIDK